MLFNKFPPPLTHFPGEFQNIYPLFRVVHPEPKQDPSGSEINCKLGSRSVIKSNPDPTNKHKAVKRVRFKKKHFCNVLQFKWIFLNMPDQKMYRFYSNLLFARLDDLQFKWIFRKTALFSCHYKLISILNIMSIVLPFILLSMFKCWNFTTFYR
jgi:hypothetical protein